MAVDAVTILVNGTAQATDKTGQDVSLFDRDGIERVQGPDLTRLLERAPGVTITRNGGPGAFTAVHVRGGDSDQLLVLIDGVRVADPASPGGGFDLGNLLMGNVAKVELQRGSNSTIWGNQALSGVLAVTTNTRPGASASAEYGARDTFYGTLAAGGQLGPVSLGISGGRYASEGFSAAAGGAEPDGFRQNELAGRATVALASGLHAFARARYAEGRLDLDGFPAPTYAFADTAEYQSARQRSGAVGAEYANQALTLTASGSSARTERSNFDAPGSAANFTADGLSRRIELHGNWRLAPHLALAFGGEREWTRFATLYDGEHRTAITGAYGQFAYDRGPLHLAAGLRRDTNHDFGHATSAGADAAYALGEGWRIVASYGEGFKAPTLFQLRSDFGNVLLLPERSRSYDAGIAYGGPRGSAAVTAFRRDTRDLIVFVGCGGRSSGICAGRPYGTYDNASRARAEGIEFEAHGEPSEALQFGATYTFVRAQDVTAGSATARMALARRPRHALTLSGDWMRGPVRLGADLRVVSGSFDDAANTVPLAGYTTATVRGEFAIGRAITLFGRVENALDAIYQTAAGYATARRSAFIGARARL
ncbi:MAG: TonB-dependent receptor [Croceibacterium sp.]